MQPQNKVNPWTWIITVVVIIILIILGFYFFGGSGSAPAPVTSTATTSTQPAQAGEANRISVTDQFPGNIVYVSSVQLAAPGYVVIKNDNSGTPGTVIGSKAFPAGINPGQVNLTSSMIDGGTYYAELYSDAAATQPILDSNGNAIMATFHASANANANIKG
jgi:hypothetical protein